MESGPAVKSSRRDWALLLAVCLSLALLGCSNGGMGEISDESGEPWVLHESGTCVRESQEGPLRRVINRVDPELCGRSLKHRSKEYVRVQPPLASGLTQDRVH